MQLDSAQKFLQVGIFDYYNNQKFIKLPMTTESVFTTMSTIYSYECGNKGSVQNKAQIFFTC